MKKLVVFCLLLLLCVAGCAAEAEVEVTDTPILTVSDGQTEKVYTAAALQDLPQAEASFKGVAYTGVPLTVLLADSGIIVSDLAAVKAVAADGYSVNYDLSQIQKNDVIVAYAQADGPLVEEDGSFRMVLPAEEGKMNVRMLVEIQAVPK